MRDVVDGVALLGLVLAGCFRWAVSVARSGAAVAVDVFRSVVAGSVVAGVVLLVMVAAGLF